MPHVLADLLDGLLGPLIAIAEPNKRIFAPFLIGAALLSSIVWALRLRGRISLARFLFPRKIWLHPSAMLDYRLMFARAALQAVLLAPFVLTAMGTAVFVGAQLRHVFGPGPRWDVGPTTTLALFTALAFLADDLGRWTVHMLAHRIPALWELHKVHHSAEVLTPFTVYRTHPLESVLMRSGAALGVGIVAGGMSFLFRGPISGWSILGIDALSLIWNGLGSNLRHSHVWLSFGRALEHVFISPAQHQIHHSVEPRHHHTNFGATFAFWDWLYGSLYVTRGRERLRFGLPPGEQNHGPTVWSAWFSPLGRILRPRSRPPVEAPSAEASLEVRAARAPLMISLLVVMLAVGSTAACRSREGDPGGPGASSGGGVDTGAFDKAALLRAFGDCALGHYEEFAAAAAALDAATKAATPSSREAAQRAFVGAMDVWQRAELFQFGPAASSTSPGGRDMRDAIYAWPLVSRCEIDKTLASKAFEAPGWANGALLSTRSLAAADYLLYSSGVDNGCPAEAEINTSGAWAALGADEIAARKLAYARVVTADAVVRAQALADAWDPAKGNFLAAFATPGKGSAFPTQQAALNAVSDATFYLDLQLKNLKVGIPAGLVPECAAPPCLSSVESPWAKQSKRYIRANVAGYEEIFRGCGPGGEGLGFDDLLVAAGAGPVAKKIDATLAEIHASLDALVEPTLEDDVTKNAAGVKRLFEALRANAAVMKAEVATVLEIELPRRVEGDND